MLENLISGLFDKEQMIYDKIQNALIDVADELKADHKDFFIMIRPTDEDFNHKFFICKYDEKGNPVKVRNMKIKEILEDK